MKSYHSLNWHIPHIASSSQAHYNEHDYGYVKEQTGSSQVCWPPVEWGAVCSHLKLEKGLTEYDYLLSLKIESNVSKLSRPAKNMFTSL